MSEARDRVQMLQKAGETFRKDSENNKKQAAWLAVGSAATATAAVMTPELPLKPVFERGALGLEGAVLFGTLLLSWIKTLRSRSLDAASAQILEQLQAYDQLDDADIPASVRKNFEKKIFEEEIA